LKEKILKLLETPTDDPEYPTPLDFDQICNSLQASPAERFQIGHAIIDLVKEKKVVRLGNLFGVKVHK